MKTISLTILLLGTLLASTYAQNHWKYEYYKTIDHTNFRDNKMFIQSVDFSKVDYALLNATIFFLTNEQRAKYKVPILPHNMQCEISAFNHAKHMVEKDFYSHENTKERKRKFPADRAELAGISNPHIAENIAYSSFNRSASYLGIAQIFVSMWMKSKGHKKNILSKEAKSFGCGLYFSKNTAYSVQVFQWFDDVKIKPAKDKLPFILE